MSRWIGSICDESPEVEVTELLEAPGESGVIGDRELELE